MEAILLPENIVLERFNHKTREEGMCAMEAAAWLAGEPHSDEPKCVCPIISAFMMSWNDSISDRYERTRLLVPLIPMVLNTRSTPEVERARAYMALDWLARECAPTWLEAAGILGHARDMRNLKPIYDDASCGASYAICNSVSEISGNGYLSITRCVSDSAASAAFDATANYANSIKDKAMASIAYNAWRAARYAGESAGRTLTDKLSPIVDTLKVSAQRLVERMAAL